LAHPDCFESLRIAFPNIISQTGTKSRHPSALSFSKVEFTKLAKILVQAELAQLDKIVSLKLWGTA
jgi:hypothetical protein